MPYDETLDSERSGNERYLKAVQEQNDARAQIARDVQQFRNTIWLGSGPVLIASKVALSPIIGRVALDYCDEMLGRDFYVGPFFVEFDDVVVLNWSAKSAGLFFEGRDSKWLDPDPGTYLGRRTFEVRGNDLTGYFDELEVGVDPGPVFIGRSRPMVIPEPPAQPSEEQIVAESESLPPTSGRDQPESGQPEDSPPEPAPVRQQTTDTPDSVGVPQVDEPEGGGSLRNEDLVRKALSRPRSGHLSSVLATLQPDQYRLVSYPVDENLVVQGHPGTGKTVVATHRAAFLTHSDEDDRLERVALIGPTDGWARHVRQVLDELGADGVEVMSMTTLVGHLANGLTHALHHDRELWYHVSWETARIGRRAALKLRRSATGMPAKRMKYVISQLVRETELHKELVSDPETSSWLLSAKSADIALLDRSYLLLAANIGHALGTVRQIGPFDHVIVDEAQDIRGAEWAILSRLFDGHGRWSLFGDMNQRRVDHTWPSWADLAVHLGIEPSDDTPLVADEIGQGYRSTREILAYAACLLPRGARNISSLLSGPEPTVRRVGAVRIDTEVIAEATALLTRHADGTVAVVSVESSRLRGVFLKNGWRQTEEPYVLRDNAGRRLSVLMPVMARGLEFDGVVVVEPSDFPENLGRAGQLYTALTRPNKELSIIHCKKLPRELKGRGNRLG